MRDVAEPPWHFFRFQPYRSTRRCWESQPAALAAAIAEASR